MTISSDRFKALYSHQNPFATIGAKPFLKWAGGKAGLLENLLPFVPKDFSAYFAK